MVLDFLSNKKKIKKVNNEDHIFVNFQHILLNKIISCLDDPIDRILFTLVCKKWYDERDSYLVFDSDRFMFRFKNRADYGKNATSPLRSYQKQIQAAINSKSVSLLEVGANCLWIYDYSYQFEQSMNLLKEYNSKVFQVCYREYTFIDESFFKYIKTFDNITTLDIWSHINLELGLLSPNLRDLTLQAQREPLLIGQLPPKLERLSIGTSSSVIQRFTRELLPESLRYLRISSMSTYMKIESLPPNLEELHFFEYCNDPILNDTVLPKSLHTITKIHAKEDGSTRLENTSLRKLEIYLESHRQITVGSATFLNLPPSLTDLSIHMPMEHPQPIEHPFLPTTIERLEVYYPMETPVAISKWMMEPSRLRELKVSVRSHNNSNILRHGSFPDGIESLDLWIFPAKLHDTNTFPSSLKKLTVPATEDTQSSLGDYIPSGLESLDLSLYDNINITSNMIPPTLKNLTVSLNSIHKCSFNFIPETVNHITITEHGRDVFHFKRLDSKYFIVLITTEDHHNLRLSGIIKQSKIPNYLKKNKILKYEL